MARQVVLWHGVLVLLLGASGAVASTATDTSDG